MILSSLQAACYQRLGWGSSPVADNVTRVTQFINDTVKEVLSNHAVQKLRRMDLPLVTVDAVPTAALPQAATKIHGIRDAENRRELDEVTVGWIDARDPGRTFSSSTPLAYAVVGYSRPVVAQPENAGQLTVKSTSASDIVPQVAVEVITDEGYIRTSSLTTLTGMSAVNIGPTDTLKVTDFYLTAACVGEVYLLDSDGNELGRIGIGATRAKSTVVEIYPTPDGVVSLIADVDIAITPLVNATDECPIPEEFQEVIIEGVRRREYEKREKFDLAAAIGARFNKQLGRLILYTASLPSRDRGENVGYSQLGPYYPQGS